MSASATLELGATLEGLRDAGPVNVPAALADVAALLLEESGDAFRRQGWRGGTHWAPRITPNVPAILTALAKNEARSWRNRWGQATPALEGTGRLRQSMTTRTNLAEKSVQIGTNVEYAALMQTGGPVTLPGAGRGSANPQIRARLYQVLKSAPAAMRAKLGWLYGVDEVTINVRARPVVELTPDVLREAKARVLRHRVGTN